MAPHRIKQGSTMVGTAYLFGAYLVRNVLERLSTLPEWSKLYMTEHQ